MKDQLEQALQAIRDRGWWDGKDFLSIGNRVCIVMALAFVADENKATGYELSQEVAKYVDLKGRQLSVWNDTHSQDEVESLLETAIAAQ